MTTDMFQLVVNTSQSSPHSWLIIGFVTRLARRVSLVEHEQLTLPEHLSSPPIWSGGRVTRSLVLCVCFVDRCLSFCTFSFGHYVVCSSQWENWNNLFCRKVSFLTAPHCQFRSVGQGMKQTYLYLWYLYCKLNGLDAINEIIKPRII
jgi:hypothetical protein